MQEVEVKILEIDVVKLEKKLLQLGARKTFEGPVVSSKFDTPQNDLDAQGKMLRLRKRGNTTELTLKKKPQGNENLRAKVREETELNVSDYETMKKILSEIGFVESGHQQKTRTTYTLGPNVHVEIDEFARIPPFAEIEATSIKKVEEIVKLLGYTMADTKPWSGKKVLEYYAQKKK